ncbi:MAG TPA: hypothetical protein VHD39_03930 [Acidimicrobiales bacterium]|nr:hypothetical protein [Acidimicrobiales bacterium]
MSGTERPGTITTVHRYVLPLPRAEVWSLIGQVSRYRSWWPWLRVFEGAALAPGDEWRCEVQPPVPYPVRFRVEIGRIEVGSLVEAEVRGDVVGVATLALEDGTGGPAEVRGSSGSGPYGVGPAGAQGAGSLVAGNQGCTATLRSSLAPGNAVLQQVSRFAAPLARFGHDWVLDSGARQFIARAVAPVAGD